MRLSGSISRVLEVGGALGGGEAAEEAADGGTDIRDGAGGGLAQKMLELGEDLLDRVEVRRVLRQEEQLGAGGADQAAHAGALVAAEIVPDVDFVLLQRRGEAL